LSPFWDDHDLAVDDIWYERITESDGIAVFGGGGGGIGVAEGVGRFRVVAVLAEVNSPDVFLLVVWFEIEGCLSQSVVSQSVVKSLWQMTYWEGSRQALCMDRYGDIQ
jgi:hypothetical protein